MAWIMEVKCVDGVWRGVRPDKGAVYRYDTQREAARMLITCYPDACVELQLGASVEEAGIRITEIEIAGDKMYRTHDHTEVPQ